MKKKRGFTGFTFTVTRRLYVEPWMEAFLLQKFYICNRIYNAAVKHYKEVVKQVKEDLWYQYAFKMYTEAEDPDEKLTWAKEIFAVAEGYGLTEYGIHSYVGYAKTHAYEGGINIDIAQTQGSALYRAIKSALLKGTEIHFRKIKDCRSFEGKKDGSAIIYHPKKRTVYVMGVEIPLKIIREKDYWLQDAMGHEIRYCRIVRESYGEGWRYFVQFVMHGQSPVKPKPIDREPALPRIVSIDPGVSTMAAYDGNKMYFYELAPDIDKYLAGVAEASANLQYYIRINNQDCYDDYGRWIKGSKLKWTRSMVRAANRLRSAYRKQRVYVEQYNNHLARELTDGCGLLWVEPMNYQALAKQAKETKRQDKVSAVLDRHGRKHMIRKYKRKTRFGPSILKHAPSAFIERCKELVLLQRGVVREAYTKAVKASQIDHITQDTEKTTLSERTKLVGGKVVQRDGYSSFINYHLDEPDKINFRACAEDFDYFLQAQEVLVKQKMITGDPTGNFGLKDFLMDEETYRKTYEQRKAKRPGATKAIEEQNESIA